MTAGLLASVGATVQAAPTEAADAALVHLAQLYAAQIDQAGDLAAFASNVLARAEQECDDEDDLLAQVRALRAKVTERDTLDRLGARLHAALHELGATPKARGTKAGPPARTGPSSLHSLRGGMAG